MKRQMVLNILIAGGLFLSNAVLRAEVKTQEKSQFKMEGLMGRMVGMFGGRAAREGVVSTVAVKGNRKVTTAENNGQIIDLNEEKIYELDLKKKSYVVTTFEEMRRRLREAQEKAEKAVHEESGEEEAKGSDREMEFDFSLKESGQKRTINGYECREVVMTITGREKGKTLEEGGGMVMTSHIWLGPNIPAMKDVADFDARYAKALGLTATLGSSVEQMAMAMAMYPAMKNMMGKMEGESVRMDGTAILTEMTMETVKSPAQVSQEQKQEGDSSGVSSVRGIGGMLGRRLGRKKEGESDPNKAKNRSTVFSLNHELLKVEMSVPDSDISVPAGFKEKK